jgi:predicted thioesterase
VKASLTEGLAFSKQVLVDEERCISFMGPENRVYATPRMVSDVEYACRDFLLAHLDAGEDSVGAHVSIDHLGATPPGVQVTIEARIATVEKRRVRFEYSVKDPLEEVGRGSHVRFVVDTAKSRERIAAKRARLGTQIK